MKKKWLFLTLIVVVLLGVGGLVIWKFSRLDNSTNQPTPNPPRKLTPAELEKYLLEKRLDLQKYFVFNLKELTKETMVVGGRKWNNGKIVSNRLSRDLTEIAKPYTTEWEKNAIVFLNDNYGIQNIDDWSGKELDKKIDSEKDYYIIFQKNSEANSIYFWRGKHTSFVRVRIKPTEEHVFENKEKALEIIKTDPALVGKV